MERQDAETAPTGPVLQSQLITNSGLLGDGQEVAQRIDHHVANHENAVPGAAFFQEMADGSFFRNKEVVCERVGKDAVDLLRHGAIKTAKTSLYVGHANTQFHGGKRDGNG